VTSDIRDILREIWPRIREDHLFPELPAPDLAEGDQHVGLDINRKRIFISKKFVDKMRDVLEPQEVLEGLLDHAISHYLYCPWDFSTHLRLYVEAKRVLGNKERAQKVTDYFMDIVADTHCFSRKETPLPKIYRRLKRQPMDRVVHAMYQKIWGIDLGVKGYEDVSRKLSRLPYLDRSRWGESIRRFARVVRPVLESDESRDEVLGLSGGGRLDSHKIEQYTWEEIEQGLKDLALDMDGPSEFREIVQDFEDEILNALQSRDDAMGRGQGHAIDADIFYYMKLAERHALPVRKTPMKKSGALYPHHHTPWEVGGPFHDIDPWTSFGKIMPGITQTWKRLEGEVFGRQEDIPDCIVIIDSSGSMINPQDRCSYAVLGAACAVDAYLRNGAKVAAYNFSDAQANGRQITPYSRHRQDIYRTICRYFGGGTQLDVGDIEDLQTEDAPDIFLITDMQITNLEILTDYFNECENRVTAVHVGNNRHVETFRRSMALNKNIGIYAVEKEEHIPRIVLGKIREYLYAASS
jgi:hypothetical protein